jgi:hypothetical protein
MKRPSSSRSGSGSILSMVQGGKFFLAISSSLFFVCRPCFG